MRTYKNGSIKLTPEEVNLLYQYLEYTRAYQIVKFDKVGSIRIVINHNIDNPSNCDYNI